MKIRTNRIAPLFLAGALAFGVAACEGDDTLDDAEQEIDQELTDEDETGDADEDEGVAEDDPTTEE